MARLFGDPSRFVILGALWVHRALGDMLNSIVSNSHFGKRSIAREVTISGSHFSFRHRTCFLLLMKISDLGPQSISGSGFCSFILAMWLRNQNLCRITPQMAVEVKRPPDLLFVCLLRPTQRGACAADGRELRCQRVTWLCHQSS